MGFTSFTNLCVAGMFVLVVGCSKAVGRSEAYEGRGPVKSRTGLGLNDAYLLLKVIFYGLYHGKLLAGGFKYFFMSTPTLLGEMIPID